MLFSLFADEVRGRVVRVADGDTITVLSAADPAPVQHKIRLHGIDAPEKDQAFGQKSKQRLSDYVFDKDVTVTWKSKDRYGRILGTVWLGSTDINLQMLHDGFAHHYKRFDSNPVYAAAELDAQQNHRGLWTDPNPVPPEEFRHGRSGAPRTPDGGARRPAEPLGGASPPGEPSSPARIEYRAGNAMPVGSRTPAPINATWPDTGYWLSTNSNKRHNRNCENYRKTRGYPCQKNEGTPCGKCGG